ncbi:hypothetical protein BH23THE1_BH23THE1_27740 [soil metagenome]
MKKILTETDRTRYKEDSVKYGLEARKMAFKFK